MKTSQRGFIVPLLLIIVALALVGGGAYVVTQKKSETPLVAGNVPVATSTVQSVTANPIVASSSEFAFPLETYDKKNETVYFKAEKADREAIQKDFGRWSPVNFFYENKDRIYFTPPNMKDGCERLTYLNKNDLGYYSTGLYGCPEVSIIETQPYYIEDPDFADFSKNPSLYVVNLDTEKRTKIYSPQDNESLWAGAGGIWSQDYAKIEILDKNTVKVSIYKRYKTRSEVPEIHSGDRRAEKIRDEIVSFRVP